MKIAYVSMFYEPTFGGVEQVIKELAERYVKKGHEVHMYCCDSDKYKRIKKKHEVINGIYVHRYKYWLRLSLSTFLFPGLIWGLLKGKYDIIHSHVSGHWYVLIAGLIAWLKGVPHIHTTHCPWTDSFRPLTVRLPLIFTYLLFNWLAFKFCTKIIAITPWEIPMLKRWTSEEKIVVIPNGMDNILYKKVSSNKFKKRYGIKGKLVLFFGRLNITKGPEKLALAAKEISKKRKDIWFVWVGPDEGVAYKVKGLIKDHENMMYLGAIRGKNKVAEMYQAADVYVLPSYREGLPLTLFEAMACGLPIVASPVNGIPYEMKNGVHGYLVKYGDLKNLQEKILKVLDNKKIAKKFSENNKKKAVNYTWDIIADRTMNEYKNLIC